MRFGQLMADAHAAVEHDPRVADLDQVGGIGAAGFDAWAAFGAEEYDARLRLVLGLCEGRTSSGQGRGSAEGGEFEKIAAIDHRGPPFLF